MTVAHTAASSARTCCRSSPPAARRSSTGPAPHRCSPRRSSSRGRRRGRRRRGSPSGSSALCCRFPMATHPPIAPQPCDRDLQHSAARRRPAAPRPSLSPRGADAAPRRTARPARPTQRAARRGAPCFRVRIGLVGALARADDNAGGHGSERAAATRRCLPRPRSASMCCRTRSSICFAGARGFGRHDLHVAHSDQPGNATPERLLDTGLGAITSTPMRYPALDEASKVATGAYHACARYRRHAAPDAGATNTDGRLGIQQVNQATHRGSSPGLSGGRQGRCAGPRSTSCRSSTDARSAAGPQPERRALATEPQ